MHYIVDCQKIVDECIVNFMITGHYKFSVDGAFGLTKKYIKKWNIKHFERHWGYNLNNSLKWSVCRLFQIKIQSVLL